MVCHGKLTNALTIDILLLEVEAPYSRQGFVMSKSSNYDGWDRMATDFFLRMENEELWEQVEQLEEEENESKLGNSNIPKCVLLESFKYSKYLQSSAFLGLKKDKGNLVKGLF